MPFYFAFTRASVAIRRCPPEHLLIAAHGRTPSLVNTPMCTDPFTAVNYKLPCHKRPLECVHARFQSCLSGEALTSMPHLLKVENLFLHRFMLTVHGCNRNQPNGPFIAI